MTCNGFFLFFFFLFFSSEIVRHSGLLGVRWRSNYTYSWMDLWLVECTICTMSFVCSFLPVPCTWLDICNRNKARNSSWCAHQGLDPQCKVRRLCVSFGAHHIAAAVGSCWSLRDGLTHFVKSWCLLNFLINSRQTSSLKCKASFQIADYDLSSLAVKHSWDWLSCAKAAKTSCYDCGCTHNLAFYSK